MAFSCFGCICELSSTRSIVPGVFSFSLIESPFVSPNKNINISHRSKDYAAVIACALRSEFFFVFFLHIKHYFRAFVETI